MAAFAANSVLARAALGGGAIGALDYAVLRFVAGAAVLSVLALRRGGVGLPDARGWAGAVGLALYGFGFAFAYLALDTGLGALILFGVVQVAMFVVAAVRGPVPTRRWAGAALALAGLAALAWQGGGLGTAPDPWAAALMAAAGAGWALFTLMGAKATDPLKETATAFAVCGLMSMLLWVLFGMGSASAAGVLLALASGAVTSGLGYALWYAVLPRLEPSVAALSQLTVPVIALVAGVVLLGETAGLRVWLASAGIVGGVAIGLMPQRRTWRRAAPHPR